MNNDYFKIALIQLKLQLDYDNNKEYLIENEQYFKQMDEVLNYLQHNNFDIILFPELAYSEKYDNAFLQLSKDKIIVYGSKYIKNENQTIVYNNQQKKLIKKEFCSAVEPSIRFQRTISEKEFLKTKLKEHTFIIKRKKFIVLNCAEYYRVAYYIARDEKLSKNLFGFLVPCANNNNQVFLNESIAIHNHNHNVYSFVANSVASYAGKNYSKGGSYIFGPISSFEKNTKTTSRIDHALNICYLDDKICLIEGEFVNVNFSNYYRSDDYKHTPKQFKIHYMGD